MVAVYRSQHISGKTPRTGRILKFGAAEGENVDM